MDKVGGLFSRKKNKKGSKPDEFGEGDAGVTIAEFKD